MFVCHNVFPHERFPFDRLLSRVTLKKGNYFIMHSKLDEKDLREINKNAQCVRTVIPIYNAFCIRGISKQDAREYLKIKPEDNVLLFLGFVREYKGLNYLIHAMQKISSEISNIRLLVVGDFDNDKDYYIDLIKKCGIEKIVNIVDGYIPDTEVELYFAACDLDNGYGESLNP